MTVKLDSPYLIPTLFGLTAVNSMLMVKEREAEAGVVVLVGSREADGLGADMPMYWTPTCWRSNWGFLGLTASIMTRKTARIRRARREKRRTRQQQQPLKEGEDDDDVVLVVVG
jgi:hypothetical protein